MPAPKAGEGFAFAEGFRGEVFVAAARRRTARSRARTCATPRGSSGRCWKPRSKATSSPTSRSATSRSTARIPGLDFEGASHAPNAARRLKRPLTEAGAGRRRSPNSPRSRARSRDAAASLGRSLSIRHVDAGSCNGCELEIHALGNPFYDLERFGLRFVASPRHADVLLVTGPVTRNMREALRAHLRRDAGPQMGDRVRRLRARRPCFQGVLRNRRRGRRSRAGRSAHSRLSAAPGALLKGFLALLNGHARGR